MTFKAHFQTFFSASLLSLTALSCGATTQAVKPQFPEAQEPEFSKVLRMIATSKGETPLPIAVGVSKAPLRLVAWDLKAKRKLWESKGEIESAPVLAGQFVLVEEDGATVARDLKTGAVRFSVSEGSKQMIGAGAYGDAVAVTLGEANVPEGVVYFVRGKEVLWKAEFTGSAGTPAVIGDIVVVPWGLQQISILNAANGEERLRLRVRDSVVGHAKVDGGGVYVGQRGLFRITRAMESGSKKTASYFEPLARFLPTQPQLFREGYKPITAPEHASQRTGLVWSATGHDEVITLGDDTLYFVFYRFVFALEPSQDEVRWAYVHSSDIAGAVAEKGGVRVAGEDGKIVLLSATDGSNLDEQASKIAFSAVALPSLGALQAQGTAERTEKETKEKGTGEDKKPVGGATASSSLATQLFNVAQTDDPRLAIGRTFAIEYLGRLPDAQVTQQLFELCDLSRAPQPVRIKACEQLADRQNGADAVLAALSRHESFLEKKDTPPVGALAKAAASMKLKQAAPLLVAHLNDPATRTADLVALIEALKEMGDKTAAPTLKKFIVTYHSAKTEPQLTAAVVTALEALAELEWQASSPLLQKINDDAFTTAPVREKTMVLLATVKQPRPKTVVAETDVNKGSDKASKEDGEGTAQKTSEAAATKAQAEAAVTKAKEDAAKAEEVAKAEEAKPADLSPVVVQLTLEKSKGKLESCFQKTPEDIRSARVGIVVRNDGPVESVFVMPSSLQACMEPVIKAQTFPATRGLVRKQVRYVVTRPGRPDIKPEEIHTPVAAKPPLIKALRPGKAPLDVAQPKETPTAKTVKPTATVKNVSPTTAKTTDTTQKGSQKPAPTESKKAAASKANPNASSAAEKGRPKKNTAVASNKTKGTAEQK